MKARPALIVFILFFYLTVTKTAFAVNISVINAPSTIDQSQEFQVNVNLSCSGCGDSYLRGVFYSSGTNYFGYTKDNSGNWSNAPGSSCTTFFKIAQSDLNAGTWSGILKFKPDKDSSYYTGPGEYSFKIGRYTSSCSSASTWSDDVVIAVTGPTPTPTVGPTSTNTPTPSPVPRNTPTPTKKPTATPTTKLSKAPTPTITPKVSSETKVLGENTQNFMQNTKAQADKKSLFSGENLIAKTFVILGIIFLILCGIVISYPFIKKLKEEKFGG